MPANQITHMITETDQLSNALDLASRLWPELKGERAALLRKLISLGIGAMEDESETNLKLRLAALSNVSDSLSGMWPGFREEQLSQWPD